MSQNNDQSRPTPSQSWYDNGQVPQSKKFPFGAGAGGDESATRMSPQIDQNGQGNTPPYGQQPATSGSQAPQFGDGQNFGGTAPGGQNYGGSQPGNQPYADNGQGQPQQYQQPAQPQSGQGPHYGENGSGQFDPNQGGQPEYGQNQPQQGYGQPQSGQPQGDPAGGQQDQMSDSGRQQFQGILDPHTGEIHPVPDLDGLQEADALLVVVSGPDSGSQILLDTDVVTVGRSPNADIFLDDVTVSRKHAEFIRTPSGFTLRDTGSLNGTYVGRQLIDSIELQNGADVQIGKFRMIFQQRPRS